jgi:hypothetical protein
MKEILFENEVKLFFFFFSQWGEAERKGRSAELGGWPFPFSISELLFVL